MQAGRYNAPPQRAECMHLRMLTEAAPAFSVSAALQLHAPQGGGALKQLLTRNQHGCCVRCHGTPTPDRSPLGKRKWWRQRQRHCHRHRHRHCIAQRMEVRQTLQRLHGRQIKSAAQRSR